MRNHCLIALLLVASLAAPAPLVAQVAGEVPPRPQTDAGGVADLKVEFAGFGSAYRAQFFVQVRLQPSLTADGRVKSYLVALRDSRAHQTADATAEQSQATIDADPDQPSEHTLLLCQAWFQVGPLYLDVTDLESGVILRCVGPLQVPQYGSGLTPYGAVGSGNDQLHLRADGVAMPGTHVMFQVSGMQAGAAGVLGISPYRAEIATLGGTLRIGPELIIPMEFQANEDGTADVEYMIDPEWMGVKFYAQAAAIDIKETGDERVLFSNGIEISLDPDR